MRTEPKKYFFTMGGILLLFFILEVFSFSSKESPVNDADYQEQFNNKYRIFSLNIPKNLNFSGEKVPLNDFDVRETLDRELLVNTYWQSSTLLFHKRASRYFPMIEKILKRNGVPDDFKYISLVESGLTNITSPAGAVGYWQIIESTAKSYGLEINEEVDERYHLEKSTEVACKYFKEAYNKFNNWTLAAASYNMGMGGIEKQLDKQKVKNYYDLHLNTETSRYLFRILATKEIISRPSAYGFILRKKDLYPQLPTYKVVVDSSIADLAEFAISQGHNYKILKLFNPWLKKNTLTIKDNKTYIIEFPKSNTSIYSLSDYFEMDTIAISDIDNTVESSINNASNPDHLIYVSKKGETLKEIASKYNIDISSLLIWNNISENQKLDEGQELVIFFPEKKEKQEDQN